MRLALNLHIRQKDRITHAALSAFPQRTQALPFQIRWGLNANHVAESWKKIEQVGERPRGLAPWDARANDDERSAHAVLEHALLAQQTVAAQGQSVVGGEDDDRVIRHAGFFERRENSPDLLV